MPSASITLPSPRSMASVVCASRPASGRSRDRARRTRSRGCTSCSARRPARCGWRPGAPSSRSSGVSSKAEVYLLVDAALAGGRHQLGHPLPACGCRAACRRPRAAPTSPARRCARARSTATRTLRDDAGGVPGVLTTSTWTSTTSRTTLVSGADDGHRGASLRRGRQPTRSTARARHTSQPPRPAEAHAPPARHCAPCRSGGRAIRRGFHQGTPEGAETSRTMTVITCIEDLRVLARTARAAHVLRLRRLRLVDRVHLPRQRERLPQDQAAPARGGQHGKPQPRDAR